MALKIVVLAKQVPDTRNVGKDAMTAEGTVNRAALPAIFTRRFECPGTGPSSEGAEPRLNSRNPHDGSSTCR